MLPVMWNRLLILLHLRREWAKELDLAPPAFDSTPHVYDPHIHDSIYSTEKGWYYVEKTLTCCAQCGGGPKHPIHTAPRPPYAATADANASKAEGMQ
jgi:hypothetical protein